MNAKLNGTSTTLDAAAAARALAEQTLLNTAKAARVAIFDALYGGGLSEPADWCTLAHWELASGHLGFVRTTIDGLHRPYEVRASVAAGTRVCALLLAAALSVEESAEEAPALVARVDSVLATGPLGNADGNAPPSNMAHTNLLVARLWKRLGRLDRALMAVRRHPHLWTSGGVHYLSESLRLEGELAEAVGDRAGAIRLFRSYLALRSDPEPEAARAAKKVRVSLERLEAAGEGRP